MLQHSSAAPSRFNRHALAVAVSLALSAPMQAYASGEVVQFASPSASIPEGNALNTTFHAVTCSGGVNAYGGSLTVNFATAGGTATSGTDFTAASGTLSFTFAECAGAGTTKNIAVDLLGDLVVEPDENFTITLSGLVNNILSFPFTAATLGPNTVRTVTVVNDDHALSIGNVSNLEGNAGTSNFNVPVTCSGNTTGHGSTVTVNYSTANGTASAGTDFTATTGTLTFTSVECDAGTTKNIPVSVLGNTIPEPDKTLSVNLSAPTGALITSSTSALVTIVNDDIAVAAAVALPIPTVGTGVLAALGGLLALMGALALRPAALLRRRKHPV